MPSAPAVGVRKLSEAILSDIFSYLVEESPWHLLSATQVCSHFRNIGLANSSLWYHIDLTNCNLARWFLMNSRSGPLHLHYNTEILCNPARPSLGIESVSEELRQMLSGHLDRVQSVHISGDRDDFTALHSVLSRAGPGLEVLEAECLFDILRSWNHTSPTYSLRTLALKNVEIPLASGIYRNLINLCLENQLNEDWVDLDDFVQALQGCPLLRTLKLLKAIPDLEYDSHLPEPANFAYLLYLQRLEICDRPSTVGCILHHISVPFTAQIDLKVLIAGEPDHEPEGFINEIIPSQGRFPHVYNIESLIYDTTESDIRIRTENFCLHIDLYDPEGDGKILADLHHSEYSPLHQVLENTELSLEELDIRVHSGWNFEEDAWRELLYSDTCDSLRKLSFTQMGSREATTSLLSTWSMLFSDDDYPTLESLTITGLPLDNPDDFETLEDLLASRYEYQDEDGHQWELHLRHVSGLTDEMVARLSQWVDRVTVEASEQSDGQYMTSLLPS